MQQKSVLRVGYLTTSFPPSRNTQKTKTEAKSGLVYTDLWQPALLPFMESSSSNNIAPRNPPRPVFRHIPEILMETFSGPPLPWLPAPFLPCSLRIFPSLQSSRLNTKKTLVDTTATSSHKKGERERRGDVRRLITLSEERKFFKNFKKLRAPSQK